MKNKENSMASLDWPPVYTLKKHAKTRYPKLRISPTGGLKIIVPLRFNQRHIPTLLEHHKTWIEYHYAKIITASNSRPGLPTHLEFSAIQERWQINYRKTSCPTIKLMVRPDHELVLCGHVANESWCKKILLTWIRKQATQHLIPWLTQLSDQSQLTFTSVRIRNQSTRWGSCTAKQRISLNSKLLFLPAHLVSHILLHELCHTIHDNHSAAFWQLLTSLDPSCKENKRELRSVQNTIATWLY